MDRLNPHAARAMHPIFTDPRNEHENSKERFMKPIRMKCDNFAVALSLFVAGCLWSGSVAHAAAAIEAPVITAIQHEAGQLRVEAAVPAGLRKVTLEGRGLFATGAWTPVAVARLDGQGGTVTFRLTPSKQLAALRIRGDAQEPLPSAFYLGTNQFGGQVTTANPAETPGGGIYYRDGVPITTDLNGNVAPPGVATPTADRAVVESDIWALSGDTLYFFNQLRGLQILDISTPDAPVLTGTLSMPAAGEQMYVLNADRIVLLVQNDCGTDAGNSRAVIVRNEQGKPSIIASLPVPGRIQESRLVGSALYVASETYRTITNAGAITWESYSAVSSLDLSAEQTPVARDTLWVPGSGNVVAANDQWLFVARAVSSDQGSQISIFDIRDPQGALRLAGNLRAAGTVKDKFKMQAKGDVFTVISESWRTSKDGTRPVWGLATDLETFSLANPQSPAKLGSLQLGKQEQLHATRFDGDRVYIVTFQRVDPLWIVDLADPAHPQIRGELEVPGWSTYIHPMGDRLLSIGINSLQDRRVAVSLFDVSDLAHPALLSKVPLGEDNSWSEANVDEKAFGILPEAGLLLVPYSSYSTNTQQGVQLVDFNAQSLTKRGFIDHAVQARRATIHGERILSISGRELLSVDATDRDQPVVRAALELAFRVDRLFLEGLYLLELSKADSASTRVGPGGSIGEAPAGPRLRISLAETPDQVVQTYSLTNLPILGATAKDHRLYVVQGQSTQIEYLWDNTRGQWLDQSTNPANLLLSVYDLAQLPEVRGLGQTNVVMNEVRNWGELEAYWPSDGTLVWAGSGSWPWLYWYGGINLDVGISPPLVFAPGGVYAPGSIISGRFWPGFRSVYDRRFVAFDVQDALQPRFLSDIAPSTNNWNQAGDTFTADGMLFSSSQAYESQITGTNTWFETNKVSVWTTNAIVVTNLVAEPHYTTTTNFVQVTNVEKILEITTVTNLVPKTNLALRTIIPWIEPSASLAGTVPTIGAGGYHLLATKPDGTLWTWGANWFGQLGDGKLVDRNQPEKLAGLGQVAAVAGGQLHSLALTADGTLWAWGDMSSGAIGIGTPPQDPNLPPLPPTYQLTPAAVTDLTQVRAIAAGDLHSLALRADGSVWGWGDNWYGALGDASILGTNRPTPVPGLAGAKGIGAGHNHSLAIVESGRLLAWGDNSYGQLGDGTTETRRSPIPVAGVDLVVQTIGGNGHTLALRADGSVWSWGQNDQGQLGDGSFTDRARPAAVEGVDQVVGIAAGDSYSAALRADGSVWAWGANGSGQLGDGTTEARNRPVAVTGLRNGITLAAGRNHCAALTGSGQIWAWGDNQFGQLGDGAITTFTNVVTVATVANVTNVVLSTNVVVVPKEVTEVTYTYTTNVETVIKGVETVELVVTTNSAPIYSYELKYYLDVVDYRDGLHPGVRDPVNLPGLLKGLAYSGALLYTVGYHWTNGTTDYQEWLDALAYDGVSAALVDSLALSKSATHPALIQDGTVILGNPSGTDTAVSAVEAWRLSAAGKLERAGMLKRPAPVNAFAAFGHLLAVQSGTGAYELIDMTDPAQMQLIGAGQPGVCWYDDLRHADGALARGIWLPLGDYGVGKLDLNP